MNDAPETPSPAPASAQADAGDDAFDEAVMADLMEDFDAADDFDTENAFETEEDFDAEFDEAFDALVEQDFDAAMPPQLLLNWQRGRQAEQRLLQLLRRRGHQVNTQVTSRAGAGGSRVDIAPLPANAAGRRPRGPTRTLESKHMDLGRYRLAGPGSALDTQRISNVIRQHIAQVQRHQQHAQGTGLPTQEALVYQLGNANDAEAIAFRRLFRQIATPQGIRGGVILPSRASTLP